MDIRVKPVAIFTGKGSEDYIHEGNKFYNMNNYPLALEMYNMAIKSNNVNPVVFFNRGCTFMAIRLFKKAVSDFSKYLKIQYDVEANEQLQLAISLLKKK